MRTIKQKILMGIASFTLAIGCAVGLNVDVKTGQATETKLPIDYVQVTGESSSFTYQTFPEWYHEVHNSFSKEKTEYIEGGMVFSASSTSSATSPSITFSTVLSASRLTKDFNVFEYLVLTDEVIEKSDTNKDAPPFDSLSLTLASKANPNNYVKIVNFPSRYHNYATTVRAGTADMTPAGKDSKGSFVDSNGLLSGSSVNGSLSGAYKTYNKDEVVYNAPSAVSYKLDKETMTVYASPSGGEYKDILVRDLDDPTQMRGLDEVFAGFEGEELVATFTVDNLKGDAKIAILRFNGAKLYGDDAASIVDVNAPDVYATNYLEGVQAEVGGSFPVFDFQAYDDIDGLTGVDSCKVYYDYDTATQEEIPLSNGAFVPQQAGTYTIVGKKEDSSGNVGTATYTVEAYAKLPPFEIVLFEEIDGQNTVGNYVQLPKALVYGGTKGIDYAVSVWYGDEQVDLDKYDGFILEKQGLYVIKYAVFDYRNAPKYFEYYIETTLGNKPIVEFPNMPTHVAVGSKISLPDFKAMDWSSYPGLACDAIVTATIRKDDGEPMAVGKEYLVESEGVYTYTIKVSTINKSESLEKSYVITAVTCEEVLDYFILNDISVSGTEEMLFSAESEGATMHFINALPVSDFWLRFAIPEGSTKCSSLTVVLTDKDRASERLTINCFDRKIAFGDVSESVSSRFGSGEYFLSFKDNRLLNLNLDVGVVETYDDGSEFLGFSSGYVYVTMQFNGVEGQAGLQMKGLCNHTDFSAGAIDNSTPLLNITSELPSMLKIGEVVTIPKTYAYDIFDGEREVLITVMKDDEMVPLTDDNQFFVTEYGKYVLEFETRDTYGNRDIKSQNLYCKNYNGPTITVLGKVATTGKVGKKITLPAAKAVDYFGEEVEVRTFVLKKGGAYVQINEDNTFIIDESTTYVIWYTAKDAEYNITNLKFVVKA